jgi:hypothetical protein
MKFKRLYIDLEVSPNVTLSWRTGYKINLSPEDIIQERAIICVCYKWEGDSQISSMRWNRGDDKELVTKFVKILLQANEIVAHNGDRFDIKWFRTRCIYHGIECPPELKTIDTLKLAKANFLFNSNKLDYIGGYLGVGHKLKTEYKLWKDILLNNSKKAMNTMVEYCKRDVQLLEDVHHKLINYTKHKTHFGVQNGGAKIDCPECASTNTHSRGYWISGAGVRKNKCQCNDCGKWFSVLASTYNKELNDRNRKDII